MAETVAGLASGQKMTEFNVLSVGQPPLGWSVSWPAISLSVCLVAGPGKVGHFKNSPQTAGQFTNDLKCGQSLNKFIEKFKKNYSLIGIIGLSTLTPLDLIQSTTANNGYKLTLERKMVQHIYSRLIPNSGKIPQTIINIISTSEPGCVKFFSISRVYD
ncbi:hypothetical protein BpHYR1_034872 [Brachionus plicatilis]|uniref:Uncharacterized protein n=1 Tax=Brachionus plicatilis TaxID=10195 RepID=A0A3M7SHZ7_BRAPC|nr:hypothetical protein BpHYR1_034872 [Brachionus plicatilis]